MDFVIELLYKSAAEKDFDMGIYPIKQGGPRSEKKLPENTTGFSIAAIGRVSVAAVLKKLKEKNATGTELLNENSQTKQSSKS
nr:hypothetical protein [uncultured Flavobacterium sp.]